MKTTQIFAIALLGLACSFSAQAQTPVVGAPGTMSTPGTPAMGTGVSVPGQPGTTMSGTGAGSVIGTGTLSPTATTPIGTTGTLSPNGVPTRNVDGGTLRTDQPAGAPSTRRLNGRTRTVGGTAVRP